MLIECWFSFLFFCFKSFHSLFGEASFGKLLFEFLSQLSILYWFNTLRHIWHWLIEINCMASFSFFVHFILLFIANLLILCKFIIHKILIEKFLFLPLVFDIGIFHSFRYVARTSMWRQIQVFIIRSLTYAIRVRLIGCEIFALFSRISIHPIIVFNFINRYSFS